MKKTKGKNKGAAKKSAKNNGGKTQKPVDLAQVRGDIANLVGDSAADIAIEVIKVAKTGQLAQVKYLFEVAGLYPATEGTAATQPQEGSLAHTLLRRMGLPLEPVIRDEDLEPAAAAGEGKVIVIKTSPAKVSESEDDAGDEVKAEQEAQEGRALSKPIEPNSSTSVKGGEDTVE